MESMCRLTHVIPSMLIKACTVVGTFVNVSHLAGRITRCDREAE